MTDELMRCLTVIFRQKGKELLNEQEFVYAASMDLHWFPPKDAQKLLDLSIKEGLLKLSHGTLTPTFELSDKHLEIDYHPPVDLLKTEVKIEKANLFMEIVNKIVAAKKLPKKEVVARINKTRERMNLDIEVAGLVVARSLEVDISVEIPAVEKELLSRGQHL
ncbi:MAG TPA: DUF2240 family protein [Thermoplasmata archaeon]|nr:DUF2240 family protein [Thermoplasmata archaeon]